MKTTTKMLALAAGSLLTVAAHAADVEIVITGSTAFRSIIHDRMTNLFDAGYTDTGGSGATLRAAQGTMTTAVPSLGSQTVRIRTSWSGSASGMNAVKNNSTLTVTNSAGVGGTAVGDIALSDVFPGSASPPINESSFDRFNIGVVPFVFVKNTSLVGFDNVTKEAGNYLMTASGPGLFPAEFVGGPNGLFISMVGRDSGSGTRISTEKCIGFVGSPNLWGTNGANNTLISVAGYASGGNVAKTVRFIADTVGYVGLADYNANTNGGTIAALTYNGVGYSVANVQKGKYSIWGYQHMVNRASQLSANQVLVRNALISAITDAAYQADPTKAYFGNYVPTAGMEVERGADGGAITSTTF